MKPENEIGIKHNQVFNNLVTLITEGYFRLGEVLSERELAEQLGVSRTPVREALRQLEREGLVVYKPRKGVTITHFTVEQIEQLYRFRETLEGLAARLMAENNDSRQEQKAMEIAIKEAEEAASRLDIGKLSQVNSRFHAAMADGSGNTYLINALNTIRHHINLAMSTSLSRNARPSENIKEHKEILEAITNRDPDLAESAARTHIRNARSAAIVQMQARTFQEIRLTSSNDTKGNLRQS